MSEVKPKMLSFTHSIPNSSLISPNAELSHVWLSIQLILWLLCYYLPNENGTTLDHHAVSAPLMMRWEKDSIMLATTHYLLMTFLFWGHSATHLATYIWNDSYLIGFPISHRLVFFKQSLSCHCGSIYPLNLISKKTSAFLINPNRQFLWSCDLSE